jgi:hypothetical protein
MDSHLVYSSASTNLPDLKRSSFIMKQPNTKLPPLKQGFEEIKRKNEDSRNI